MAKKMYKLRDLYHTNVINPVFEVREADIQHAFEKLQQDPGGSLRIPESKVFYWALAVKLAYVRLYSTR